MPLLNITSLSSTDRQLLFQFLSSNSLDFLPRKNIHSSASRTFNITHNLIRDSHNPKRYFVISNEANNILGWGNFSKTRRIIGVLEVDDAKRDLVYSKNQHQAIRITNPKSTQERGQAVCKSKTQQVFSACANFPHLGIQPPIERPPYRGRAGFKFFSKYYSVMNQLPGEDLVDAIAPFIKQNPNIQAMIDGVFIPILLAYKQQIADKGFVHRDLKLDNIRGVFQPNGSSIINILDCDDCVKVGSQDQSSGTPGYAAPEVCRLDVGIVTPARDIFSLGITFVSCLNSYLYPDNYFKHWKQYNTHSELDSLLSLSNFLLARDQCYDPDKLLDYNYKGRKPFNLFARFRDVTPEVGDKLKRLIKGMTALDPANRPALKVVIDELQSISCLMKRKVGFRL